jgi:hypothetical protein
VITLADDAHQRKNADDTDDDGNFNQGKTCAAGSGHGIVFFRDCLLMIKAIRMPKKKCLFSDT